VDRAERIRLNRAAFIDGLTNDVQDTSKRAVTDRDGDGSTRVDDLLATDETLSTVHGNATNGVFTKVLGNLKNESVTTLHILNLKSVEDSREVLGSEVNVNNGTDDGTDVTDLASTRGRLSSKTTGYFLLDI
jgi:hypothetical protein